MATPTELQDSIEGFAQSCNENQSLRAMIKDWKRVIQLEPSDSAERFTLTVIDGVVTSIVGAPAVSDLNIQSTAEILTQIFYGELSPNEPYNSGALRIQGSEADILRLDFVIAMIWE